MSEALDQLLNHQTQLDMDGIRVGVSRQAISEVADEMIGLWNEIAALRDRAEYWQEIYEAIVRALSVWPALPDEDSLIALGRAQLSRPGDWEQGKKMQRERMGVPAISEAESGAGIWWRVTGGQEIAALRATVERLQTVTPEMVEAALDVENPYWRGYGAGLQEIEREEMHAALEAALAAQSPE